MSPFTADEPEGTDDLAVENGAVENGAVEDGAVEDGAVEDGAVEDGAVENPAAENPAADAPNISATEGTPGPSADASAQAADVADVKSPGASVDGPRTPADGESGGPADLDVLDHIAHQELEDRPETYERIHAQLRGALAEIDDA